MWLYCFAQEKFKLWYQWPNKILSMKNEKENWYGKWHLANCGFRPTSQKPNLMAFELRTHTILNLCKRLSMTT